MGTLVFIGLFFLLRAIWVPLGFIFLGAFVAYVFRYHILAGLLYLFEE